MKNMFSKDREIIEKQKNRDMKMNKKAKFVLIRYYYN